MGLYGNIQTMVEHSMPSWRVASSHGLTGIRTTGFEDGHLVTSTGHRFINMISCSYLGLNRHPLIVQGAIDGLLQEGVMSTSASRARIAPALMDETERLMSEVFGAEAIVTPSATTSSAVVLPLLASGHLTDTVKPLLVFDKNCHFSMSVQKAVCGNETQVVTCPHNDVTHIEHLCRTHECVAYVADGAYSMGDNAPMQDLMRLQREYGLFLYFDDSHSISVHGTRGEGFVRSQLESLGPRTIIVASLAKAFGATGGLILFGAPNLRELFDYCGGPLGWSQMINAAGLGAVRASARIHLGPELRELQARLAAMMRFFDATIPTSNAGNGLPIRVIDLGEVEKAVHVAGEVYRRGFYTSAVFFPIAPKGRAGLRVMGRADMCQEDIERFCEALFSAIEAHR